MERQTAIPGIGVGAALLVVLLVALPYALGRPAAVGAYYAPGIAGPPVIALFGLVAAIILLAARMGRTEPAMAAGIVVVLSAFMVLLALVWALAVTPDLAGGVTSIDAARYHRWLVVAAATALLVASGWFARAVL